MRYLPFGTQGHKASQVVMGLMRIRSLDPVHVARVVEAALEEGINMLDTAPAYDPSEKFLGEVFAANPGLRDRVILQTKLGIRDDPKTGTSYYDFSKEHILESVDKSLMDMQTDHIDSLLLHRPDALMDPAEIADAFRELKAAGKVLDFGVSNHNPAMMKLLASYLDAPLVANQIQLSIPYAPTIDAMFHVNRMDDEAAMRDGGILEHCRRTDVVVQAWSPLQYNNEGGCFMESRKYPELNVAMRELAQAYGVEPAAIAIAWILRYPGRTQAVIGTTQPERVHALAQATQVNLTRTEWYHLYRVAGHDIP